MEKTDRMRLLLIESITTLCRSGISYSKSLKVEGLLAITIDEGDVMVVNVNKGYEVAGAAKSDEEADNISVESECSSNNRRSINSCGSVSPSRSQKRESLSHREDRSYKMARHDADQLESNYTLSDNTRDIYKQSVEDHSQQIYHVQSESRQPYATNPQSYPDIDKKEIKIEIMDSDSDQGDANVTLYDELNSVAHGQGQLVQVSSDCNVNPNYYTSHAASSKSYPAADQLTSTHDDARSHTTNYTLTPNPNRVIQDHEALCKCCIVLQRKRQSKKIRNNTRLPVSERLRIIKALPPIIGLMPGSKYIKDRDHRDVCQCCSMLDGIRQRERLANRKCAEKQSKLIGDQEISQGNFQSPL